MKIIGLTGLTGAGKSTVAKMLIENGCYHIDADAVAKDVINHSDSVKNRLKEQFGNDIINIDGTTNRQLLAKCAFANKESTNALNAITHPAVTDEIRKIIKLNSSYKGIIIDAIALFESKENELCDFTVTVLAPEDIRLERIMNRDCISKENAILRMKSQKDESFYKSQSDIIINNFPPYKLENEISKIIENL